MERCLVWTSMLKESKVHYRNTAITQQNESFGRIGWQAGSPDSRSTKLPHITRSAQQTSNRFVLVHLRATSNIRVRSTSQPTHPQPRRLAQLMLLLELLRVHRGWRGATEQTKIVASVSGAMFEMSVPMTSTSCESPQAYWQLQGKKR